MAYLEPTFRRFEWTPGRGKKRDYLGSLKMNLAVLAVLLDATLMKPTGSELIGWVVPKNYSFRHLIPLGEGELGRPKESQLSTPIISFR